MTWVLGNRVIALLLASYETLRSRQIDAGERHDGRFLGVLGIESAAREETQNDAAETNSLFFPHRKV